MDELRCSRRLSFVIRTIRKLHLHKICNSNIKMKNCWKLFIINIQSIQTVNFLSESTYIPCTCLYNNIVCAIFSTSSKGDKSNTNIKMYLKMWCLNSFQLQVITINQVLTFTPSLLLRWPLSKTWPYTNNQSISFIQYIVTY